MLSSHWASGRAWASSFLVSVDNSQLAWTLYLKLCFGSELGDGIWAEVGSAGFHPGQMTRLWIFPALGWTSGDQRQCLSGRNICPGHENTFAAVTCSLLGCQIQGKHKKHEQIELLWVLEMFVESYFQRCIQCLASTVIRHLPGPHDGGTHRVRSGNNWPILPSTFTSSLTMGETRNTAYVLHWKAHPVSLWGSGSQPKSGVTAQGLSYVGLVCPCHPIPNRIQRSGTASSTLWVLIWALLWLLLAFYEIWT